MRKKHRKRQGPAHQASLPLLVFEPATVRLIQQSLFSLETSLQQHTRPLQNRQLAQETLTQVKKKLEMMIQREEWESEAAFDYNEMWLMYTSLTLHLVELRFSAAPEQKQLTACIALCKQFHRIIENTKRS